MKDEQLRILTDQNSHLLKSLDQVEEANTLQLEKLAIKRKTGNFVTRTLSCKVNDTDAAMRKAQAEMATRYTENHD